MRVLPSLCLIVLAVLVSAFVSVAPAAAQGSTSDPTGGASPAPAPTRSEASVTAPRIFVPPTLGDLKLSLRFAFARYISLGAWPTRALASSPADLPTLLYDMNAFAEESARLPLDVELEFSGGAGI